MKLDNRMICIILGYVSPQFIKNQTFEYNEERIKSIWKYLDKKKLYDVDKLIKNQKITQINIV